MYPIGGVGGDRGHGQCMDRSLAQERPGATRNGPKSWGSRVLRTVWFAVPLCDPLCVLWDCGDSQIKGGCVSVFEVHATLM